jgi:Kef-type K+ transport system membrane component KefB
MFSSTIIGLKLLPEDTLQHQKLGDMIVGVLLLQDLLAIFILIVFEGLRTNNSSGQALQIIISLIALPIIFFMSQLFARYVIGKIITHFAGVKEYIWVLAIGWCMFLAEVGQFSHISEEVGAFIGGIALSELPMAEIIAEELSPLRDLFLVMFFFSVGAQFDLDYMSQVMLPAIILAALVLIVKPLVFKYLSYKELNNMSWEFGIRLAQASEFSLLVAYLAGDHAFIGMKTSSLIQATTIITFIVSSYWVVLKYPTPISAKK